AIYIGVANTPSDGTHHWYLMAGNRKLSSAGFYAKAKMKVKRGAHSEEVPLEASEGVVFKLIVDKEKFAAVLKNMEKGGRDLTCLGAVCRVLKASGIEM